MSPDKISISTTLMQRSSADIVAEARTWIGTRWVHQGRSRHGIDCAGLVVRVMSDLGIPVEDRIGYKRTPNGQDFLEHIKNQTDPASGPAPGRIAIFRQSLFPCHVGIFSELHGEPHFIHSYMPLGEVMEEHFNHKWPKLLVEVRTIRGLVD